MKYKLLKKFIKWRINNHNNYNFLLFLSVITGFGTGLAAILIKNLVHIIHNFVANDYVFKNSHLYFFLLPTLGILVVILFSKYILKQEVGDGVPKVLYYISKNNAFIKAHNLFSSIITSSITVGFGGSVGLEGPMVVTGSAIGSNIGRVFKIDYRQKIILIGAATSGVLAAVFSAPIAGVAFALEVMMIDLNTRSIIPILLASVSGSLTSTLILGNNYLCYFQLKEAFTLNQVPFFIILGIFSGLIAVYFTKINEKVTFLFEKFKNKYIRLLVGGAILGLLIYFFPALYGEGYESVNQALTGNFEYLFDDLMLNFNKNSFVLIVILLLILIFFKIIASSLTIGAGGVGGMFAPTLFTGANVGVLLAMIFSKFGQKIPTSNAALVGMAGLLTGVMHAPLTGIFLIGEITQGYALMFPLMVTSTFAYITVRIFQKNNIYTSILARRKEVLTHHADNNMLSLIELDKVIEKDFATLNPNCTLKDIIDKVSESNRNLFPVVDNENNFLGIVSLNRLRKIMFKPELYNKIYAKDLMYIPDYSIEYKQELPDEIAEKLQKTGIFIIVVLENQKYVGFISRANFFSHYRSLLKDFSAD